MNNTRIDFTVDMIFENKVSLHSVTQFAKKIIDDWALWALQKRKRVNFSREKRVVTFWILTLLS